MYMEKSENLKRESSRRHLNQMSMPLYLTPFEMQEQQLFFLRMSILTESHQRQGPVRATEQTIAGPLSMLLSPN